MKRNSTHTRFYGTLAPTVWHGAGAVRSLFNEGFMELPAPLSRMDDRPAMLAVVLETRDAGAEVGGKLATALLPLTFVTDLIVEDVWLQLDLKLNQKNTHLG